MATKTIEILDCTMHTIDWPKTIADLDEIASTYNPDFQEAPITLDHKKDGPAFGRILRVFRQGTKLLADIHIGEKLRNMIYNGEYRSRSVELYRPGHKSFPEGHPLAGKAYLKALSLLGAAAPAVKGMPPLELSESLYAASEEDLTEIEYHHEEGRTMPDKKPEATQTEEREGQVIFTKSADEYAAMREENAALQTQMAEKNNQIEDLQGQIATFQEAEANRAREAREAQARAWFGELVEKGRAIPTQKEKVLKLFLAQADGGNELFEVMNEGPKISPIGDTYDHQPAPGESKDPLEAKTQEIMAERKCSYAVALSEAARSLKIDPTAKTVADFKAKE